MLWQFMASVGFIVSQSATQLLKFFGAHKVTNIVQSLHYFRDFYNFFILAELFFCSMGTKPIDSINASAVYTRLLFGQYLLYFLSVELNINC